MIRANTIGDAQTLIVNNIIKNGIHVIIDGVDTLESEEPLVVVVQKPISKHMKAFWSPYSDNYLEQYAQQFLNYLSDLSFEYTYGERIYNYPITGGVKNQVNDYIIPELKRDNSSRRAILHLWNVEFDTESSNVPCLQTIQYLIRNNTLYTVASFRSNDMLLAWGCNVYGITMLSKHIADELGVKLGDITTISTSAHIYIKRDVNILQKVIKYL